MKKFFTSLTMISGFSACILASATGNAQEFTSRWVSEGHGDACADAYNAACGDARKACVAKFDEVQCGTCDNKEIKRTFRPDGAQKCIVSTTVFVKPNPMVATSTAPRIGYLEFKNAEDCQKAVNDLSSVSIQPQMMENEASIRGRCDKNVLAVVARPAGTPRRQNAGNTFLLRGEGFRSKGHCRNFTMLLQQVASDNFSIRVGVGVGGYHTCENSMNKLDFAVDFY